MATLPHKPAREKTKNDLFNQYHRTKYFLNSLLLFNTSTKTRHEKIRCNLSTVEYKPKNRVSEPACFGAAPALGIFYPEPALASGKREQNVGIFKTDYKLSKTRSNTCSTVHSTSTYRSLFMFYFRIDIK